MGLLDQIIGAESGGDANARNPNSSAVGAGQFLARTWMDMLGKYRPDLITGKSREEILALRTDPNLSRDMTDAYAKENAGVLSGAGFEASPGNTYLAHFAGPQGAVKVLGADPSAPVSSILDPAAVKANPFLQKMTAGDLIAWAGKKMGTAPALPPPTQVASLPSQGWSPPATTPAAAPQQTASPGLLSGLSAGDKSSGMLPFMMNDPLSRTQLQPIVPAPQQRRPIDLSRLLAMRRFA
jgi:hypothetical protein